MQSNRLSEVKRLAKAIPGSTTCYRVLKGWFGFGPARARKELNAFIKAQTKSIVQTGPFAGMILIEGTTWGDGDISPKLLGVYEQDLHSTLDLVKNRSYGAIIDIGCAEGYYAVGLARLFPDSTVYAFDADEKAVDVAGRASEANGVSDRIVLGGFCDPKRLIDLAAAHGPLLVLTDCEGYEVDLFSSAEMREALVRSDLIIECHDKIIEGGTKRLVAFFEATHAVTIVQAIGRNPNQFDFLADLHESDRWLAVSENRPYRSHWIFCDTLLRSRDS